MFLRTLANDQNIGLNLIILMRKSKLVSILRPSILEQNPSENKVTDWYLLRCKMYHFIWNIRSPFSQSLELRHPNWKVFKIEDVYHMTTNPNTIIYSIFLYYDLFFRSINRSRMPYVPQFKEYYWVNSRLQCMQSNG